MTEATHPIVKAIEQYYELTRYSVDVEGAEDNEEWNAGYNAALAIAKAASHDR